MHTSAKDTATNSHMANVDTDAKIIDTVEFTGLEDNQEYYLKSALVETTMNSGNYGNAFLDASRRAVQPTDWRKKGESVCMQWMRGSASRMHLLQKLTPAH